MRMLSALVLAVSVHAVGLAQETAQTFYVQLIRGTDADKPQQASWKPVGPKLSRQFTPRFRWKTYWEIERAAVIVAPGKVTRIKLGAEREVEVDLNKSDPEVRLFTNGVLSRRCRDSLRSGMCIMGGTRDNDESWFVVVRRDPPL